MTQRKRTALLAAGQVQGVGFRPFIYRLAVEGGLSGSVGNTSDGVRIEVQGSPQAVDGFALRLRRELPPLARLTRLDVSEIAPVDDETGFVIVASHGHAGHSVLVSPDVGICEDCLRDMHTPGDPRFGYAFTNCTNCGPRYTITRSIPYDRATTSMACFPFCPRCEAEYRDPLDRRFHAQPVACPQCGPRLWLVDNPLLPPGGVLPPAGASRSLPDGWPGPDTAPGPAAMRDAVVRAAALLHAGRLVALKGLGGFQLACDARDARSVALLRLRKHRPHKPLALMVPDLATARELCRLAPEHEALLLCPEKPIVLCPARDGVLPRAIAPDTAHIGLMLPYTPLHAVLFDELCRLAAGAGEPAPVLVMTSANASGEPICLGNREALRRLAHLADAWLLHDRDILVRVDDSVAGVRPLPPDGQKAPGAAPFFYRRARGYVPRPVMLPEAWGADLPCVLGAGGELKATLCLTRGNEAFVSQHVGDLENAPTFGFYEEVARHLQELLEVRPAAVVCDLHPDFLSARHAAELARREGLPLWRLQHHAAHAASVLTEHGHTGPALALTLDGTGLGTDGSIWGGELLRMELDAPRWQRLGRLAPFRLPGGEAAIREPWRMALGLALQCGADPRRLTGLWTALPDPAPEAGDVLRAPQAAAVAAVSELWRRGLNCPPTSSAGRLFDAVAAALGLCTHISYEGQAAIRLEAAAARSALPEQWWRMAPGELLAPQPAHDLLPAPPLDVEDGLLQLDSAALFAAVLDARDRLPAADVAARFHWQLARGFAALAARAARETGLRVVGLSGGVMQNALLARLLPLLLTAHGLTPLCQQEVPPGDGGISLGQAAWAQACLRAGLPPDDLPS